MTIAWFTPWPPQPSGIAGRSAERVGGVRRRGYGIDVFVDEQDARVAPRAVVACARGVISHSRGAARQLAQEFADARVDYVPLGEGRETFDVAAARLRFRGAHGIDPNAVVFGIHGALTAEKRVPQLLRA